MPAPPNQIDESPRFSSVAASWLPSSVRLGRARATTGAARQAFVLTRPNAVQLDELAKLADADRLKATVETIPPLSNAIRGHELSERSDMRGKIVLGVV
jgi:NADPH:quinone reductase-like Zn-dependent oxidoreductase